MKKLVLVILFSGLISNLKAQQYIEYILPDSIISLMIKQDSIEYETEFDSISNGALSLFNCDEHNFCRCRKKNAYTPTNDEILYDKEDHFVLIYEDHFNFFNGSFWEKVDGCNSECWDDPNLVDCNGETKHKEIQWYQSDNIETIYRPAGPNTLAINLKKEPATRSWPKNWVPPYPVDRYYEFTSGFLKSKYALPYSSCILEARIKLPHDISASRMNPAFWLMGYLPKSPGNYTELDIFEFFDSDTKMSSALHDGHVDNICRADFNESHSFFDDWHTYKLFWNKAFIAIFIDNKLVMVRNHVVTTPGGRKDFPYLAKLNKDVEVNLRNIYPHKGMRIFFNLQLEKCWNERNYDASFPQTMEMDWLKIWYQLPCFKDLVISDLNQIPQVQEEINMIAGKNISCNVNTPLDPNVYLKVIHTGTFTGTKLTAGPNGYIEILPTDPDDCGTQLPPQNSKIDSKLSRLKIENNSEMKFEIFPNPAKYGITLLSKYSNGLNVTVSIFNLVNKLVKFEQVNVESNSTIVDVSMLEDGLYFLELLNKEGQKEVKKLLICKNI